MTGKRHFSSESAQPTRRQFLRHGMLGAWMFGLGSALGLLPRRAHAAKSAPPKAGGRSLGPEFSYDVSSLRKVDPKLVTYKETGAIPSGCKELRAVILDQQERLLIAGDRRVAWLDKTGSCLKEISLSTPPRCLAVDPQGTLFVGLRDHLEIFDNQGARQAQWPALGPKSVITAIAVTGQDVLVADAGNRVVLRFDRAGKMLKEIGKKNPAKNISGFIVPSPYFDLAVGREGLLWIANPGQHRLEAFTLDGDFELAWGLSANSIEGFCGCCNPVHFSLMPDGRFVTSEKGLPRIKIYSAKGKFESVVAGPDQFPRHLDNPNAGPIGIDIAVDAHERVLAADSLTGGIRVFTPLNKT